MGTRGWGQMSSVWLYHQDDGKKSRTTSHTLQSITYSLDPSTGVATACFNTPKNLNALRALQFWEMFLILEHAAADPQVRCLLWTGAGRAFNAGADWNPAGQMDEVYSAIPQAVRENYLARGMGVSEETDIAGKTLTLAFWDFPKPSVCAVNGMCVGGGANIALANFHDYVVCSHEAKFMWPFSKLGLTPELGSSYTLPRIVGVLRAKELLMTNSWCSAEKALEYGLCNKLVAPEHLKDAATAIATSFARSNGTVLRMSKGLIHSHLEREALAKVLDRENASIVAALASVETIERQRLAMIEATKKKAAKAKAKL